MFTSSLLSDADAGQSTSRHKPVSQALYYKNVSLLIIRQIRTDRACDTVCFACLFSHSPRSFRIRTERGFICSVRHMNLVSVRALIVVQDW